MKWIVLRHVQHKAERESEQLLRRADVSCDVTADAQNAESVKSALRVDEAAWKACPSASGCTAAAVETQNMDPPRQLVLDRRLFKVPHLGTFPPLSYIKQKHCSAFWSFT